MSSQDKPAQLHYLRAPNGNAIVVPQASATQHVAPAVKRELSQLLGGGARLLLAAWSQEQGETRGVVSPTYKYEFATSEDGRALIALKAVISLDGSQIEARYDAEMFPGQPMWYIANWERATHEQRVAALNTQIDYPDPAID